MWEALADATGSYSDGNTENGEVWQYMGTYDGRHQFRHRSRPESCRPIKGYVGKHCDRVYLHLDAKTLKVVHLTAERYLNDRPSDYLRSVPDYCGSFDGFVVTSDACPGF